MKIGPDQIAENQAQNDASCGAAVSRSPDPFDVRAELGESGKLFVIPNFNKESRKVMLFERRPTARDKLRCGAKSLRSTQWIRMNSYFGDRELRLCLSQQPVIQTGGSFFRAIDCQFYTARPEWVLPHRARMVFIVSPSPTSTRVFCSASQTFSCSLLAARSASFDKSSGQYPIK